MGDTLRTRNLRILCYQFSLINKFVKKMQSDLCYAEFFENIYKYTIFREPAKSTPIIFEFNR
jgi:hypothetical protein